MKIMIALWKNTMFGFCRLTNLSKDKYCKFWNRAKLSKLWRVVQGYDQMTNDDRGNVLQKSRLGSVYVHA